MLDVERPVLAVPHEAIIVLSDGRKLHRWAKNDPRKRAVAAQVGVPGAIRDIEGWDGPRQMIVICSLDDTHLGPLLHASVSYQRRDPSWHDLKCVRYALFPSDIDVMCMLPRDDLYVSGVPGAPGGMDSHVFHMQQTPEGWGMR